MNVFLKLYMKYFAPMLMAVILLGGGCTLINITEQGSSSLPQDEAVADTSAIPADEVSEAPAGAPAEEPDAEDLVNVVLYNVQSSDLVLSPLLIKGEARGTWYSEASFPVTLTDVDGVVIASGSAIAIGDWMTEDFVPFNVELTFTAPTHNPRGLLTMHKANPSGLPENADWMEIPVDYYQ